MSNRVNELLQGSLKEYESHIPPVIKPTSKSPEAEAPSPTQDPSTKISRGRKSVSSPQKGAPGTTLSRIFPGKLSESFSKLPTGLIPLNESTGNSLPLKDSMTSSSLSETAPFDGGDLEQLRSRLAIRLLNDVFADEKSLRQNFNQAQERVHKEFLKSEGTLISLVQKQKQSGDETLKSKVENSCQIAHKIFDNVEKISVEAAKYDGFYIQTMSNLRTTVIAKMQLEKTSATYYHWGELMNMMEKLTELAADGVSIKWKPYLEKCLVHLTFFYKYKTHRQISPFYAKWENTMMIIYDEAVTIVSQYPAQSESGKQACRQQFQDLCEIMNLIPGLRREVCDFIVLSYVREYQETFKYKKQLITKLQENYKFIKQQLEGYKSRYGDLIPKKWYLKECIAIGLVDECGNHVSSVLSKFHGDIEAMDFIEAIKQSMQFEEELDSLGLILPDDDTIPAKWSTGSQAKPKSANRYLRFSQMISVHFKPFMSVLLTHVQKVLNEILQQNTASDALPKATIIEKTCYSGNVLISEMQDYLSHCKLAPSSDILMDTVQIFEQSTKLYIDQLVDLFQLIPFEDAEEWEHLVVMIMETSNEAFSSIKGIFETLRGMMSLDSAQNFDWSGHLTGFTRIEELIVKYYLSIFEKIISKHMDEHKKISWDPRAGKKISSSLSANPMEDMKSAIAKKFVYVNRKLPKPLGLTLMDRIINFVVTHYLDVMFSCTGVGDKIIESMAQSAVWMQDILYDILKSSNIDLQLINIDKRIHYLVTIMKTLHIFLLPEDKISEAYIREMAQPDEKLFGYLLSLKALPQSKQAVINMDFKSKVATVESGPAKSYESSKQMDLSKSETSIYSAMELSDDQYTIAAYEFLYLCLFKADLGVKDKLISIFFQNLRLQLKISNRSSNVITNMIQKIANEFQGELAAFLPSLQFRVVMLLNVSPSLFDDYAKYKIWQERQLKVACLGLAYTIQKCDLASFEIQEKSKSQMEVVQMIFDSYIEIKNSPAEIRQNSFKIAVSYLNSLFGSIGSQLKLRCTDQLNQYFMFPCPYPLNMGLYTSLVKAYFDDEDQGKVVFEMATFEPLFGITHEVLGINSQIHNICYLKILFEKYLNFDNPELLTVFRTELGIRSKQGSLVNPSKYESNALESMITWSLDLLEDYRTVFATTPADIPSVLDVFVFCKHLQTGQYLNSPPVQKGKRDLDSSRGADSKISIDIGHIIQTAMRKRYRKMTNDYRKDSPTLNLSTLKTVAESIVHDIEAEAEDFSPGFVRYYPASLQVAIEELLRRLHEDITTLMSSNPQVDSNALELIIAVENIKIKAKEVGFSMPSDILTCNQALIRVWTKHHQSLLQQFSRRAVEKTLVPMSDGNKITHSVIDLLTMFTESLSFLSSIPNPDLIRYSSSEMLKVIGDIFNHYGEEFIRGVRSEISEKTQGPTKMAFPLLLSRPMPVTPTKPNQPRASDLAIPDLDVTSLALRINNIHFAIPKLRTLFEDLDEVRDFVDAARLDELIDNSRKLLDELMKVIAMRLVDHVSPLFKKLYTPTIASSNNMHELLVTLQNLLVDLREWVFPDRFKPLVSKIFKEFIDTYISAMLDGGGVQGEIKPEDEEILTEDIEKIATFFIVPDANGIASGLSHEEVKTALIGPKMMIRHILCKTSEELAEKYRDYPQTSKDGVVLTGNNIFRFCRTRNDRTAQRLARLYKPLE